MFRDRRDAGLQLSQRLKYYKEQSEVLVLSLPRGGVVTGFEIARFLNVPLDVISVRKLGFPGQPELAIGAVSETGTVLLNHSIIATFDIPDEYIRQEISRQKEEIARRIHLYRKGRGIEKLEGKVIILVDDGVATGATMKTAIATLREEKVNKLIVALPVAPPETADELKRLADEFICIEVPLYFPSVGTYYQDFSQVTDSEVIGILKESGVEEAARG